MLRIINVVKSNQFVKEIIAKEIPKINDSFKRFSSFRSSAFVRDLNEYPEVEILKNPPEWKYVEMLLAPKLVPKPKEKSEYPSGWTPSTADPTKVKYFVNRTRSHMIPVYLKISYRGERRLTLIRRIEGDIWLFERELRKYIEKNIEKVCATRINELCGQITVHGDHVNLVKQFLVSKGF